MNGVQTRLKCKPNVKRCKRFVFAAHSPLLHPNTLKTKAIIHFQTDHILTRFVFPPLDRSLIKKQKALDKYYCIDNGMRGAVLMPQSNDNGKNLENIVFMQLNRMRLPSDKITYYQGNCECDFVLQREDSVIQLIQVTWSMIDESTREREIKGLLEAASVTGCGNLVIVTKDEEDTFVREDKEINVIPAWKWLLQEEAVSF